MPAAPINAPHAAAASLRIDARRGTMTAVA
jgi:hypothetical protein